MGTKFYKDSNNLWHLNGTVYPTGSLLLNVFGNDKVNFQLSSGQTLISGGINVTDLVRENETPYASISELLSETKDFFVKAPSGAGGAEFDALVDRVDYLEAHAYDTLWVDYWDAIEPVSSAIGEVWFNDVDTIKACTSTGWSSPIPIEFYKLYVDASSETKQIFAWNNTEMVAISVPLTKAIIEALLTGQISSHTHPFTPTTTLLSTTLQAAIQEAASLVNKLQVIDTANWGANPTKTLTVNMFNRFTANQVSTDSVTVALGAVANTNLTNNFYFTFRTGATLPSAITFPITNVKWLNNTPLTVANMAINKIYEVLFEVLDSTTILASYGEF